MRRAGRRRTYALVAAMVAIAVLAPPTTDAGAQPYDDCSQYDVTGEWQITQGTYYTPTVVFDDHPADATSKGIQLTGSMAMPDRQWQTAGWKSPVNPLVGEIVSNKLTFTVTAPHRDGFVSRGKYDGIVTYGDASGTAIDLAAPGRGSITWSATGTSTCLAHDRTGDADDNDDEFFQLAIQGDDYALQSALDAMRVAGNTRDAHDAAADLQADFAASFPDAGRSALDLVRRSTFLAALTRADGKPLLPTVHALLPILLRMAAHGVVDDPDYVVAAQRLLAIGVRAANDALKARA